MLARSTRGVYIHSFSERYAGLHFRKSFDRKQKKQRPEHPFYDRSAELISVFLKVLLRFRATWGRKHAGLASYTLVRVLGRGVSAGVTTLEQFGKGWEG